MQPSRFVPIAPPPVRTVEATAARRAAEKRAALHEQLRREIAQREKDAKR